HILSTPSCHACFHSYSSLSPSLLTGPAPTETYTLSLHDALPIWSPTRARRGSARRCPREDPPTWRGAASRNRADPGGTRRGRAPDRKSTRLNSSHQIISYAVFCLKKKKTRMKTEPH